MILKKRNMPIRLFLLCLIGFLVFSLSFLIYRDNLIFKTVNNLRQKIMTYDTGFSSMKTILGRNAAIQAKDLIPEIPKILPDHILKFINLKKSNFLSRNSLPVIEINIPFKTQLDTR